MKVPGPANFPHERNVVRNKYVIGYWAWGLPEVPPDWRHCIPFVHEIWVPSAFSAAAVRQIVGDRPVRVVPHPVALRGPAAGPSVPRPDRPFTALLIFNMSSSFARKNPLAAIAAFRKAFGDDPAVRLIIKTSNSSAFPTGIGLIKEMIGSIDNMVLVDWTMTAVEIEAFYNEGDVVMSLHRSEGFDLTLAKAMLCGLPVMATDWSGSIDFVTPETGMPVPYRLIPAEDPQGTFHHPGMVWADADVDVVADALQRLFREPELARRLGAAGAAYATRTWSGPGYTESVRRYVAL